MSVGEIIILNIAFYVVYSLIMYGIRHWFGERAEAGVGALIAAFFLIMLGVYWPDHLGVWNWIVIGSWFLALYMDGKKFIELS